MGIQKERNEQNRKFDRPKRQLLQIRGMDQSDSRRDGRRARKERNTMDAKQDDR